jgi:hypothetical protein
MNYTDCFKEYGKRHRGSLPMGDLLPFLASWIFVNKLLMANGTISLLWPSLQILGSRPESISEVVHNKSHEIEEGDERVEEYLPDMMGKDDERKDWNQFGGRKAKWELNSV